MPLIQHRRISPESAEPAHASDHQPSLPNRRRGLAHRHDKIVGTPSTALPLAVQNAHGRSTAGTGVTEQRTLGTRRSCIHVPAVVSAGIAFATVLAFPSAIAMATERCFGVPIAGERFATKALVSSAEVAEHCLVADPIVSIVVAG